MRGKNALSVLVQCFAITSVVSVLWVAAGYGLTFGDGGSLQGFIGSFRKAWFSGMTRESLVGTIPESLFAMFQMTFAIITPALVIGGYAERVRFSVVLWFSALWLMLVYVRCAWVWGAAGWQKLGVIDFAVVVVPSTPGGRAGLRACHRQARGFRMGDAPHACPAVPRGHAVGGMSGSMRQRACRQWHRGQAVLCTHGARRRALAWMLVEWQRTQPSALCVITGWWPARHHPPASGFVESAARWPSLHRGISVFFATQLLSAGCTG